MPTKTTARPPQAQVLEAPVAAPTLFGPRSTTWAEMRLLADPFTRQEKARHRKVKKPARCVCSRATRRLKYLGRFAPW